MNRRLSAGDATPQPLERQLGSERWGSKITRTIVTDLDGDSRARFENWTLIEAVKSDIAKSGQLPASKHKGIILPLRESAVSLDLAGILHDWAASPLIGTRHLAMPRERIKPRDLTLRNFWP
jgi:hypothetical protein